jgi:hypothetical protein
LTLVPEDDEAQVECQLAHFDPLAGRIHDVETPAGSSVLSGLARQALFAMDAKGSVRNFAPAGREIPCAIAFTHRKDAYRAHHRKTAKPSGRGS